MGNYNSEEIHQAQQQAKKTEPMSSSYLMHANLCTQDRVNLNISMLLLSLVKKAKWKNPTSEHGIMYKVPTLDSIYYFIRYLFQQARYSFSCNVISCILLHRMVESGVDLTPGNWQGFVLTSIMISQKLYDDISLKNSSFSKLSPQFSLKELNKLEATFMQALNFKVAVTLEDYKQCLIHLSKPELGK